MDNHKDSYTSVCEASRMRGRIMFKLVILCIPGLINLPGSTGLVVCFSKHATLSLCEPLAFSCTEGIINQASAKVYNDGNAGRKCSDACVVNHSTSGTVSGMADRCIGASNCSITYDSGGSNGVIDINFTCAVSTNTLNPTASPLTPSISESNTKPSTEGTPSSTDPDMTSSAQASKNTLNTTVSPPPSSLSGLNTTTSPKGMSSSTDPDVSSPEQVSTNTLNPTASPPTPSISKSNTKPSTEGTPSSTDPDMTSSAQASTNILNTTASPPTTSIPDSNTKPSTKGTLSSTDPDVSSYGQASKNTLNTTVSPPPPSISGSNTGTSPMASTNTLNPTASPPTPFISESNTKPSTEGTPSSTDPDITSPAKVTDNRYTAAIVVSVVAPITTVVVVVSIIMYRRGHCKLLVGICTKRFDKHSADRADAYALSSTANANPTYNFSIDVHLNGCDGDYSEIDKIKKEPDVEYNHLNLINKEAVHEPTYNHIGHFNSSSGNTEQTYDHVGNETLQKTDLSTIHQDTYMYSHIGAMAKPASEQMVEDSYAHINGLMKDPSTSHETNQYDVAFFHLNVGPAGDFGNQDMKSSKEREFNVIGPSKVNSNNEPPVSQSYFILEKHEKEA